MQRRTLIVSASVAALVIGAACADSHRTPTELLKTFTRRSLHVSAAPTLDSHIRALIDSIFDKGKQDNFMNQWNDLVKKLADAQADSAATANDADGKGDKGGKKDPGAEVRKQLSDLVADLQSKLKAVEPPAGETADHVLARLALYMALYVYQGPTATEPSLPPAGDAVLAVVDAHKGGSVQTPSGRAGVSFPRDALTEQTIVVISATDGSLFTKKCTGPLTTKLCQYPDFFTFSVFPDVTLLHPAQVAICEVNSGARAPLADHTRFRLAHTKPADPSASVSGGSIVDGIEILPSALAGTLITCAAPDIPQSGNTQFFSDFDIVDPLSAPDLVPVAGFSLQQTEGFPGDAITVRAWGAQNIGAATASSSASELDIASDSALTTAVSTLTTAGGPPLDPGATASFPPQQVVLPAGLAPGTYFLGARIDPAHTVAESDFSNNVVSVRFTVMNPSPSYTVTDLGALGAFGADARGINDHNLVFGRFYVDAGQTQRHGYVWSSGVMTEIGSLGGGQVLPTGFNNLGEIVGISSTPDGVFHGFYRSAGGAMRVLDLGDGTLTRPNGINDAGDIVGGTQQVAPNFFNHAIRWPARGAPIDLGNFGFSSAPFVAVNQLGQGIINWNELVNTPFTGGILWSPSAPPVFVADLTGPLPNQNSLVFAVNDSGVVVGFTGIPTPTSANAQAFIWSAGSGPVGFGPQGVTGYGEPNGINNHGVVVGGLLPGGTFVWNRSAGIRALPLPAGMTGGIARAINNSGVIVGAAVGADGNQHALMWTPVP